MLALPDIQQLFVDIGVVAKGGTPTEMRNLLVSEIQKWGDVIVKGNIPRQKSQ